jgi:hypothetical protein
LIKIVDKVYSGNLYLVYACDINSDAWKDRMRNPDFYVSVINFLLERNIYAISSLSSENNRKKRILIKMEVDQSITFHGVAFYYIIYSNSESYIYKLISKYDCIVEWCKLIKSKWYLYLR